MISTPQIIELLCIAAAILIGANLLAMLYVRYLNVEFLRHKCEFKFQSTVVNNDNLPDYVKTTLMIAYQAQKKSFLRMWFSRRPLQVKYWFTQEQIDTFFNEAKNSVP